MGFCCGGQNKEGAKIDPNMKVKKGGPQTYSEADNVKNVPELSKEELAKQRKKAMQSTKPPKKHETIMVSDTKEKLAEEIRNKMEKANLEEEEDRFLTNFGRR